MRMRRKNNKEKRLEGCDELLLVSQPSNVNLKETSSIKEYINFSHYFANDCPIELEIGCGKGGFITQKAILSPNINFIAVDKFSNVILDACECVLQENIKNVRFLNVPAESLSRYIKDGLIERIYLNFPTPLPKLGYQKQRLTNEKFLSIYKQLLKAGGEVVLKTDKADFFDYSIEQFELSGFKIIEKTYNMYENENLQDNIATEHEKMFVAQGSKICRLNAKTI